MLSPLSKSKCCNAGLRFVERGCKAGKVVCLECLKVQEDDQVAHFPQEMGGKECEHLHLGRGLVNGKGGTGYYCVNCHKTIPELLLLAQAKGTEKERERIVEAIDKMLVDPLRTDRTTGYDDSLLSLRHTLEPSTY